METKNDIIISAYKKGRISGLTTNPTPEDIKTGLEILEDYMAEWFGGGICVGYNFETIPNVSSVHNIKREYLFCIKSNLMLRLCANFNKIPNQQLVNGAATAFSRMLTSLAVVPELKYSSRMPLGSGNTRYLNFDRFYRGVEAAPIGCTTSKMVIGNTNNFYEPFTAYLDEGEAIASYTIEGSNGLTISNDVISGSRINYTVKAIGDSPAPNGLYQVKIVMTTDATPARVETRLKNFDLIEVEID